MTKIKNSDYQLLKFMGVLAQSGRIAVAWEREADEGR
jgi:hypothetical protein